MLYWTEKCPNCGAKFRQNDLNNNDGYGTPILYCPNCNNPYLHPKRIELAWFTEHQYKGHKQWTFMKSAFFMSFWVLMIYLIFYVTYIDNYGFNLISALVTAVYGALIVWFFIVYWRKHSAYLDNELLKSQERMKQPGYREMLEKSGYDPQP